MDLICSFENWNTEISSDKQVTRIRCDLMKQLCPAFVSSPSYLKSNRAPEPYVNVYKTSPRSKTSSLTNPL